MGPIVIHRAKKLFTVLDDSGLVLEDITKEAVEDYFCAEFKKRFWSMCKPEIVSDEEYKVLTGKILCCDCGAVVTKYNPSWKESNQRCERCKQ